MALVFLVSCSKDNDPEVQEEELYAIAFAPDLTDEEGVQTRATTTPLANNFIAFGYKADAGGTTQLVFNGYAIEYGQNTAGTTSENTHDYSYIGGTSLYGISQEVKYWDFGAGEYHFWGIAPSTWTLGAPEFPSGVTISDDGTALTIPVRLSTTEPTDIPKYSELLDRKPVTSDVVRLYFKRAYSKLSVQFYTAETIEEGETYNLTDITFAPDPSAASPLAREIYTQGNLRVTYPKKCDSSRESESIELDVGTEKKTNLSFDDIQLDYTHGTASNNTVTAPVQDSPDNRYYVLPMGVASGGKVNPSFILTLRLDDEEKTAVVPAAFMQWKPNIHYTYIFKIAELGKVIEFYDVLIEPWHYGGSQEEEWRNW